jgi:hypothetical protein
MATQKPNLFRTDPNAEFKKRVFVAKTKETFPRNYRDIILKHYPQYKTAEGKKHISNVMCCSSPDYQLTLIIEQIAAGQLTMTVKPLEFEVID